MNKPNICRIAVCAYALILFALNFIRIFDNNFWADETFTINLVQHSVREIVTVTAADVHPPLYYLIVKAACVVLGGQPWLYHAVSLIPCALVFIFSLTAIWDRIGGEAAVLLITLAGLSGNAVCFNVEVRMYSYGALFLLLAFYGLYRILSEGKKRDYIGFVIFSLAAAYTHYYCLVSAAFFYAALLVLAVFFKRCSIKKVLAACACTVLGYLPWFFILLDSMLSRVDDYWITEIPTFRASLSYLFSDRLHAAAWIFVLLGLLAAFLYESTIVTVGTDSLGKPNVSFSLRAVHFSDISMWMAAGIGSVIGTICVGILVSKLIRPFYFLRYIYPVSIIAWLVFGVTVTRLKGKRVYCVLWAAYLLFIYIPPYTELYTYEKETDMLLEETLAATVGEIGPDDVILTDIEHIDWAIAAYYYPGVESHEIDPAAFPALDRDICYWLITWGSGEGIEDMQRQAIGQGFACEQVVDGGILGAYSVCIYRIKGV